MSNAGVMEIGSIFRGRVGNRWLGAIAVGGVVAVSAFGTAQATPAFTVDPANFAADNSGFSNLSSATPFVANNVNGLSSALITILTGDGLLGSTQTENGWVKFNSFSDNNSNPVGLVNYPIAGSNYELYLTFQGTSTTTVGTVGSANNQNVLNSLNAQLWISPNLTKDTFVNASPGTAATVLNTTGDVELWTSTLSSGLTGFNSSGGPYLNATLNITLTTAGTEYFTEPVPFYTLAFEESNTTPSNTAAASGFPANGSTAAITQDTVQQNFIQVPEPASLSIIGSGLLALGVFRLRRSH